MLSYCPSDDLWRNMHYLFETFYCTFEKVGPNWENMASYSIHMILLWNEGVVDYINS